MKTLLATLITPQKSYCFHEFIRGLRQMNPLPTTHLFVTEQESFRYTYNYHHAFETMFPNRKYFIDSFEPHYSESILRIMQGRQLCLEHARSGRFDALIFLDDDIVPHPNFIEMLAQTDGDLVGALVYVRDSAMPDRPMHLNNYIYTDAGELTWIKPFKMGDIIEVDRSGHDCILLRKHVFEQIDYEYDDYILNNEADDFSMCRKAKELGYSVKINTNIWTHHVGMWNTMRTESSFLDKQVF